MSVPDEAYVRLLNLRTGLRQFERWSEEQARAAGLTPAQHQLLLAIRGHGGSAAPTVGEVAEYLLLRHHSTVELVDRAEAAGLVVRQRDDDDHRVVRLYLTDEGSRRLQALSALHLEELERLAMDIPAAWKGLGRPSQPYRPPGAAPGSTMGSVQLARAYDVGNDRSYRVLVDRLWPRGVAKDKAHFDEWAKDVAPSAALRTWYGHVPQRFAEFSRRYQAELKKVPARAALEALRSRARAGPLTLVTATKDLEHSGAAVLQRALANSKADDP